MLRRQQVDVEAVDLGELLDLARAGQGPGDRDLLAGGQDPAQGQQVAVVGTLRVGAQRDLEPSLGRQGRGVDERHRLLHHVGEDALERRELEDRLPQAHEVAERAAKTLSSAGFRVTTSVTTGDARSVILDAAAEWNADLIVMGSHGRTGLGRFFLGSVSEAVARHARCSVQIVRIPS